MSRTIAAVMLPILMIAAGSPAFADRGPRDDEDDQEITEWLRKDEKGKQYQKAEEELRGILDDAEEEEIPSGILMNKVREGASKRVTEEVLVSAVESELARLRTARTILEANAVSFPSEEAYQNALKELSLFLLNGLTEEQLSRLLAEAQAGRMGIRAALAAGKTLMVIVAINGLDEQQISRLGDALLASEFSPEGYDSVASLFLKANVYRIDIADIVEPVIEILRGGGGLVQLENAVRRRIQTR